MEISPAIPTSFFWQVHLRSSSRCCSVPHSSRIHIGDLDRQIQVASRRSRQQEVLCPTRQSIDQTKIHSKERREALNEGNIMCTHDASPRSSLSYFQKWRLQLSNNASCCMEESWDHAHLDCLHGVLLQKRLMQYHEVGKQLGKGWAVRRSSRHAPTDGIHQLCGKIGPLSQRQRCPFLQTWDHFLGGIREIRQFCKRANLPHRDPKRPHVRCFTQNTAHGRSGGGEDPRHRVLCGNCHHFRGKPAHGNGCTHFRSPRPVVLRSEARGQPEVANDDVVVLAHQETPGTHILQYNVLTVQIFEPARAVDCHAHLWVTDMSRQRVVIFFVDLCMVQSQHLWFWKVLLETKRKYPRRESCSQKDRWYISNVCDTESRLGHSRYCLWKVHNTNSCQSFHAFRSFEVGIELETGPALNVTTLSKLLES